MQVGRLMHRDRVGTSQEFYRFLFLSEYGFNVIIL